MAPLPRVTAIVVSYNRADDLALCLDAIRGWTGVETRIVVVDNASRDAAPDVAAARDGVRLIRNRENVGFAAANNIGLAVARGDYVALVNNDAVTARDWARRLVAFLQEHPEAAAAGGRQFLWDGRNPVGDRSNRYRAHTIVHRGGMTPALLDAADRTREVATLNGAAVMIRRAAIDDVGEPFLDPLYFMYFEETDFFARALRRGWRLFHVAAVDCWHRSSPAGRRRGRYLLERNRLIFAYRHFDDAALADVVGAARRRAGIARWKRLVRRHPKYRARMEAWRWARGHQELLRRERAGHADRGGDYLAIVRRIQQDGDRDALPLRTGSRGSGTPGRAAPPSPAPTESGAGT